MKKFKIFFTAVALTLSALSAVAQNITVSGTVKDEAGDPIVGANVILAGSTTVYDLTGMDGSFKISVPGNGTLVVSSLGFVEQQIPVNGRTALNIVLESDSQMLDETIVVAFGTATKESFTGSAKVLSRPPLPVRWPACKPLLPAVLQAALLPSESAVSAPFQQETPRCMLWTACLTTETSTTSTRTTWSP